jgi:hypothetical protein
MSEHDQLERQLRASVARNGGGPLLPADSRRAAGGAPDRTTSGADRHAPIR